MPIEFDRDTGIRAADHHLTRRSMLVSGTAVIATVSTFVTSHGIAWAAGSNPATDAKPTFTSDRHDQDLRAVRVHEGKGTIDVKLFFKGSKFSAPAVLLTYDIPPGCSEGVHTHNVGDTVLGSYDEFYYILSGTGQMEIAGQNVPVTAGDHVFTPNGVSHGIENTSSLPLKVYLVAVTRD